MKTQEKNKHYDRKNRARTRRSDQRRQAQRWQLHEELTNAETLELQNVRIVCGGAW